MPRLPTVVLSCPVCRRKTRFGTLWEQEELPETDWSAADCLSVGGPGRGNKGVPRDEDGRLLSPGEPGRGFRWFKRQLTGDERGEVVRVVRAISNRLCHEAAEELLQGLAGDAYDDVAAQFIADAEVELEARQQLVREIREQRNRRALGE